ncbi:CoA pyrophosphatase [Nocardia cyriacigeorgica]|uniref:CoA pyrophosphatase n=1 Tax=Nocardia cyriacigeorgica TaxID=135487 RepID=A0A6P1CFV4_9NOCA|nr:CoA pyrophosphatase [Nocardia cyriacigeorgica]MBF6081476.1 CoA pyrophosphatase [Nocardia cyriacigeorgica]MBF6424308.1 CoA pyrophosphatase [Nocardia cyriacigeorgica]NEW31491.1 CoA pyrophosphatase [Nocardia cyriacigeorgica]BDT88691.1 coenzyme A pyrophosphatase [Nocardia cyriacigeorgica]BDU08092.1 coenzyme A pyrophosphatase [Nocardia cyriacigeorgica]
MSDSGAKPWANRSDDDTRSALADALSLFPRRAVEPNGYKPAAVAIAIVTGPDGPGMWLTERAPTLRAHAGQFALPGGRLDAGEDTIAAALRELHEELGVELQRSDVLGLLDDYPTRSGYLMTPVVVWAGADPDLRPNPAEVAVVHRISFTELDVAPEFARIDGSDRPLIRLPLLGGHLHAPTAAIMYQFREVALHRRHTRVDHIEQPRFAWE